MKKLLLASLTLGLFSVSVEAGPNYLSGRISNITSWSGGLMVMLDTGLPDNCIGTPYGWMLIPESSKTMIAVTLMSHLQGKRIAVYTNAYSGNGYCTVNQVDPEG